MMQLSALSSIVALGHLPNPKISALSRVGTCINVENSAAFVDRWLAWKGGSSVSSCVCGYFQVTSLPVFQVGCLPCSVDSVIDSLR
eukprot:1576673-Amphidinium_carterae.2